MRIALTTVKVVPPPCLKFMAHPTQYIQIHLNRDDILQFLLYFLSNKRLFKNKTKNTDKFMAV